MEAVEVSETVEAIEAAAIEANLAIEASGSLRAKCIKTTIKRFLELDSFASEASHVWQRNQNKRCFKLDSFASEASHVYRKVRPLASEGSPSARSAQVAGRPRKEVWRRRRRDWIASG